ncbi:N-acetylmuramoyl-L-alanine amidase [Streptomyces cyaneofuscatus]|uniref:N-acetylmuramoyl-L-alanine amidase n=1 Tax=Streptomyces cyaneofuscatus TaxID=66883 RepID=UPI0036938211
MPYDDSVPPTRRARPLLAAAALAALSLTTITGCGGSPDTAEGTDAKASPSVTPDAPATPKASPTASLPQGPLTGRTVVIDPGHNPRNREHTKEINEQVDIGTGRKECDTTGTSTDDGYAEARFTLDVSHRLRELLQAQGARVLLTHDDDRPFGPCIDERARIGNEAKADAVVSVHADGSAVGNRGFHVILPAAVKGGGADTSEIVKSSADLGARIAGHFVRTTGSAPSNYIGGGTGLDTRDDLGGLNLSTVPKVFVECGNMRDPKDAALLTDARWRQKAAQGMADGIAAHLKG